MYKRVLSLCLAVTLLLSMIAMAPVNVRAASQMTTSDSCLSIIKELEGFSGKPYKDTDGKYTIGYGTRCPDALVSKYMATPMTEAEADAELRKEMLSYEKAVNSFIDRHGLSYNQGQFDAVISLVFNVGTSWLTSGATLIRALADGASDNDLIYAFSVYSMSGGSRSIGHVKRRLAEANMYLNSKYSRTPPSNYSYVLYNANGGTLDSYDVQGYDANLTATPATNATYSGKTFQGWYTKASGGSKVTKLDGSTKGITLYAHWGNGGAAAPEPSKPATPDGTAISAVNIEVTGSSVNIRSGPGLSYSVVKTVARGTKLTITATHEASGYVWGKSSEGWICLEYTNFDNVKNPSSQTPEQKPTGGKVIGTVTSSTLNVRSEPDGTLIGRLGRGDKVEILEQKTSWGRVWGRYTGGWICLTSYVSLETETDQAPTPDAPAAGDVVYGTVVNASTLNVRSTPEGKIVGKLFRGNTVEITDQKTVAGRTWGKCSKGWICLTGYVELSESEPASVKTYATVVTANKLNVRTAPDGSICDGLLKGTKVEILEQKTVNGRLWGKCSKGWICLWDYVKIETVAGGSTSTDSGSNGRMGTVDASALNIRKGAGTNYDVVGKFYRGDSVEILEEKTVNGTGWGRCSKGWVCLDYVDF